MNYQNHVRAAILEEANRQKMSKVDLSAAVIQHMRGMLDEYKRGPARRKNPPPEPRISTNPETVMRFLRGETEGGAYIIDACLAVLGMRVEPQEAIPA